ncbi:hypothetical protein [Kangiella shandongensis]|uniref:hypothetical protein n=1 Tax=Kangiella shandongensis TaxID=2763258 RepID=UPI001CBD6594|nr:hypothetical protein [Kangiella shandongensis]
MRIPPIRLLPLLTTAIASISLIACATNTASEQKYTNIQIANQGLSVDRDPLVQSTCEDFQLTESQIQSFFNRAKTISEQELHHGYDLLPCYSEGTLTYQTQEFHWLIRAGGTGELTNSNKKTNVVCPEKESGDIQGLH